MAYMVMAAAVDKAQKARARAQAHARGYVGCTFGYCRSAGCYKGTGDDEDVRRQVIRRGDQEV